MKATRREFVVGAGVTAALGLLTGRADAKADAGSLYRHAFVLDCNSLANIGDLFGDTDAGQAYFAALHASGIQAFKCTLGVPGADFEQTLRDVAAVQALVERRSDVFLKVTRFEDLDSARREHKVALIFSFEIATPIESDLRRIDLFREIGVRVMQLTYNRASALGHGCLDGEEGGLTERGREAIARMNVLGVALDLSHSNTQTTAEGIAASRRPPIFSHTGCRAVHAHPRNKEDRELRALAEKGGVAGIYMLPFLTDDSRQPMLNDYIQHVAHALDVCGEEHVGIGTDLDITVDTEKDFEEMRKEAEQRRVLGISAPGENQLPYIPDLNTPRKLELVTSALLERGYGSRTVEKVLGLNFRRAFREIW
jgi:membrane dipeptidase